MIPLWWLRVVSVDLSGQSLPTEMLDFLQTEVDLDGSKLLCLLKPMCELAPVVSTWVWKPPGAAGVSLSWCHSWVGVTPAASPAGRSPFSSFGNDLDFQKKGKP